jgi:DsbC/DsbD-like thiol-disulfide interchange protein
MRTFCLFAAAGLLALLASPATPARPDAPMAASPWVELHSARVRLVAGPTAVAVGTPFVAGVEIVLAEGWKTYWRMPGEAGVPPLFDWSGSDNAAGIEVRYPAPVRLQEPGAQTVGYKGAVVFPVEVMPADASRPVVLKLALEAGICREICIPGEARLALTLAPQQARALPAELAQALARVPRRQAVRRSTDPELVNAALVAGADGGARLVVDARIPGSAAGADLFIEAPESLYVPLPKQAPAGAVGAVRFEAGLAPDLVRDLAGKVLTLTLVSESGASEALWKVP